MSISTPERPIPSLYDIKINALDTTPLDLAIFKGKYILFVNVASKCGFTKQYNDLQQLSNTYQKNLTVIGVPCNQFGKQEPGDAQEIAQFCQRNFGVTFPITEKVEVKGKNIHPLYQWLTSKKHNGVKNSSVKWNFQKYLVAPDGTLVKSFLSITPPLSSKITKFL
ncbi:MAG: glutathione peroxidase [Gilvibacter sp.]